MRGSICGAMVLIAVVGFALPGSGQAPAAQTSPAAISRPTLLSRLPYMAEFKTLRVQTLANGTAITHETTEITAIDSKGRKMTAKTEIPAPADQIATTHFRVFDPVAHVTYDWSFPGREATVMAIPFPAMIHGGCGVMVFGISYANEKTTVEDLGTMAILGVEARGSRSSTSVSSQTMGKQNKHKSQASTIEVRNDELWQATDPGLAGLVVREASKDMSSIKTSMEMVNFSQSEPNAAIFRPPAGYEIVNREVNADPCAIFVK